MIRHRYKRVLLKLSGEGLMGKESHGLSKDACQKLASLIKGLHSEGIEVGVVVGAGNIFRGIHADALGLRRSPADNMGMLATLINGLALQQALENEGRDAQVLSALECPKVAESYTWSRATRYLERGKIVIFVGGTGNPYFTTDTAAALRASEIQADILLKATKVDGVYDKDPMKHDGAVRYDDITFSQVLAENLAVMDATAIAMCRDNKIPILVFDMAAKMPLSETLAQHNGTLVHC